MGHFPQDHPCSIGEFHDNTPRSIKLVRQRSLAFLRNPSYAAQPSEAQASGPGLCRDHGAYYRLLDCSVDAMASALLGPWHST